MLIGVISEKEKSVICESCLGFPVAQTVKNLPAMQETQVRSLGREDALEKGMNGNPLQYSCLENPWTEEPGGLQSMGGKQSDTIEQLTLSLSLSVS